MVISWFIVNNLLLLFTKRIIIGFFDKSKSCTASYGYIMVHSQ
nr:MAG TPA: hypothetical protein [Caudoviricetes sp.]